MTEIVEKPTGVLAGVIAEWDETTEPVEEKAKDELRHVKTPIAETRTQRILRMKLSGVPAQVIASAEGINVSNVYKHLRRAAEEYREQIENVPAANLVAESLQFLDHIEAMCMQEANSADAEKKIVDPKTGDVTVLPKTNVHRSKLAYLRAALAARDAKMKLMLDTGVMPREPDKIYHTLKGETGEDGEDYSVDRTKEQVRESVLELLRRARQI